MIHGDQDQFHKDDEIIELQMNIFEIEYQYSNYRNIFFMIE